jgi:hypothetical protein
MLTFSVYDGTNKQTVVYPVNSTTGVIDSSLLTILKDNDTKFISEESMRTIMLSMFSSYSFKETSSTQSGTASYIGLDSLNNDYRDVYTVTTGPSSSWIKPKFFFGKRSYSGTSSWTASHDIMSVASSLLSSDTDTFFFNTKKDTDDNRKTKIRFLAGKNIDSFINHPFIQSQIIETGVVDSLSFDIINNVGSIDVRSVQGTVSVNNIGFSSIATYSSYLNTDGRILLYNDGFLEWGDITYIPQNWLGTTGSETNIQGSPVYVNGYALELTDSRWVPFSSNDITIGSTFSQFPISDIINRMVYPYVGPNCSIRLLPPFDNGLTEVGTFPEPIVEFTIYKKTLDTGVASLINMIPGSFPSISSNVYQNVTDVSNGIVLSPITATATEFSVIVSDGSSTASSSTYLKGIYPYFYGFSLLNTMTNVGLSQLIKSVEDKGDKLVDLAGTGNYYFIYDFNYGTLSQIEGYGTPSIGSFSVTSQVFSSPTGLWAGKEFYVYKWSPGVTIGPLSENFEFKY